MYFWDWGRGLYLAIFGPFLKEESEEKDRKTSMEAILPSLSKLVPHKCNYFLVYGICVGIPQQIVIGFENILYYFFT